MASPLLCDILYFVTLPAGAVAKYCDERVSVCLSVCLSVHGGISGTTRAIFNKIFMHVAYGHGSVFLPG